MGSMKIKDPSLVVQVPVAEYNKAEGKNAKVKDANDNGVVDHEDSFAKDADPQRSLEQMCRNRAPADTGFATTSRAQKAGFKITEDQNDSGTTFQNIPLSNGMVVPSYGGYIPELNGCGFNRGISIVDAGKKPDDVVFIMDEARGVGVKTTINTKTGDFTEEVPE